MKELKKTMIDGVEYGLYPLSPFKSAPVLTKLLRIVGASLVKLIIGTTGGSKDIQSALETNVESVLPQLADSLEALFEKMDENDIEYFSRKLLVLDLLTVDGNKVSSLEIALANKSVFHLLKLLKFALEVNYKDFLAGNLE